MLNLNFPPRAQRLLAAFLLCAALAFAAHAGAQQPAPPAKQESKPAASTLPLPPLQTLPADALKLGVELKQAAKPDLRKWIEKLFAEQKKNQAEDPARFIINGVQQAFAASPVQVRDAVTYLSFFLAYESAANRHADNATALRRIDKEIADLREELHLWEERLNHPPAGSQTANLRDADMQRITVRMQTLESNRLMALRTESVARQSVDALLELINYGYKNLAKFPPASLKDLRAPKS